MCKYKNKVWLLMSLVFCLTLFPASALESNSIIGTNYENETIVAATVWLEENYGDYYYLRNVDAAIVRQFETTDVLRYTIAIECETMLKANTVYDLPYVQGMQEKMATQKNINAIQTTVINEFIADLEEYIGVYTHMTLDVVAEVNKLHRNDSIILYFQDGYDTTLYPIEILSINDTDMKQDGSTVASEIIASHQNAGIAKGYSSYKRTDARDYAQTYSSNPTSCTCGSSSCVATYNSSKWTSSYTGYGSTHSDCANFVSQAMRAGGLPTDTTWYAGSSAWIGGLALKNHMTSKGYWDTSTFAAANAGNIIRWYTTSDSPNHVGMITLNDTVTHRYSAHTRDRLDYAFTNSSYYQTNCEYYTIKTN